MPTLWVQLYMTMIDHSSAQELLKRLEHPLPIKEAEEIEAGLKAMWTEQLATGLKATEVPQFIQFFAEVGFIPKFKSYGIKYAAPFGYSLFALADGKGFSIQVHEESKVEAFHILAPSANSFMLLGEYSSWQTHGDAFIESWAKRNPTENPMVSHIAPGDVAVVSSLNIVHTVIGGVLEEYATTSYDAVTRLHDQNAGHETSLPSEVTGVAEILDELDDLEPKRNIHDENYSWGSFELERPRQIVNLPDAGLQGHHLLIQKGSPSTLEVNESQICTIVAMRGDVMIELDDIQIALPTGTTTAIPPGTRVTLVNTGVYDQARLAVCKVSKDIAVSDLRNLGAS